MAVQTNRMLQYEGTSGFCQWQHVVHWPTQSSDYFSRAASRLNRYRDKMHPCTFCAKVF